jgi:hypothetical protein
MFERSKKNPQIRKFCIDKGFVSRFVDNAMQLLEAAESAVQSGHAPSDLTILISPEGGIHMVAESDWPLDTLQLHHGARMAYRVSQTAANVRVEGRTGSRTCVFETAKPERAARLLLQRPYSYLAPVVDASRMIEASFEPSAALESGVA